MRRLALIAVAALAGIAYAPSAQASTTTPTPLQSALEAVAQLRGSLPTIVNAHPATSSTSSAGGVDSNVLIHDGVGNELLGVDVNGAQEFANLLGPHGSIVWSIDDRTGRVLDGPKALSGQELGAKAIERTPVANATTTPQPFTVRSGEATLSTFVWGGVCYPSALCTYCDEYTSGATGPVDTIFGPLVYTNATGWCWGYDEYGIVITLGSWLAEQGPAGYVGVNYAQGTNVALEYLPNDAICVSGMDWWQNYVVANFWLYGTSAITAFANPSAWDLIDCGFVW